MIIGNDEGIHSHFLMIIFIKHLLLSLENVRAYTIINSVYKLKLNMADEDDGAAILILYVATKLAKKKKRRRRSVWVKPCLAHRKANGIYSNLINELRLHDEEEFRRYMRMSTDTFLELLELVKPFILGVKTHLRSPISAGEKLSVTLRFIATGESYRSLSMPSFYFYLSPPLVQLVFVNIFPFLPFEFTICYTCML